MECAFGDAFAGGRLGPAMLERIGGLAHEVARGSSRPSSFNEGDVGVGTEAEEVLLACAGAPIAEQPRLGAVRLDPQGEPTAVSEKVRTGACRTCPALTLNL